MVNGLIALHKDYISDCLITDKTDSKSLTKMVTTRNIKADNIIAYNAYIYLMGIIADNFPDVLEENGFRELKKFKKNSLDCL